MTDTTPAKAKPPTAVCRDDGEPLVLTFEWRGYEFVCVKCQRKYGYLQPAAATTTPELDARLEANSATYEEQRAARQAAPVDGA